LNPNPATTLPHPASKPRLGATLLVGGAIALAVGGATAGWMLHGAEAPAATPAALTYEALADEPAAPSAEPAKVAKPAPARRTASTATSKPRAPAASGTTLETKRVAAICADCGIVEAVRPVTRKGEGSGVGAVAGGVVGAVVGNQVGGGNGRKAMTVLGAIGGGLAGHEIEKRAKSETVYEVKVRMEDGSLRTITQATEPAAGSRVIVDGQSLRPASSSELAPRMLRTSTGA
jgi:outer membrane lipoprotein SlyB